MPSGPSPPLARAALLATAGAVLALFVLNAPLLHAPYDFDEANYVAAARLGVLANLLERGSMAPAEFVRMARAKRAGVLYESPAGYDESRDPLLRRHYHPPAVVAALALVPADRPEWIPRLGQLLVGAVFVVALIQLYLRLAPTASAAGLVAMAVLTAWAAVLGFAALSYHGWEALGATLAALAAGRWLERPNRRDLVLAGLAVGASTLILVTGIFVAAGVVLTLLLARGTPTRRERWRAALTAMGIAAATVAVVWPGALLKASALKIAAFHLYRAGRGTEFADVPSRLPMVAAVMAPLVVAAVCALLARRPWRPAVAALVVVGAVYTVGLMPLALLPVYLLPGAVPLALAAACAIASWRSPRSQAVALTALTATLAWSAWAMVPERARRLRRENVERLVQRVDGRRAYVDGAHIYELYTDGRVHLHPLAVSFDGEELFLRERGHYRPLRPDEMAGSLIAAQTMRVRTGQTPRVLAACRDLGETEMLRWFDCAAPPAR